MKIQVSKDNVIIDKTSLEYNHKGEYNVNECTFSFDDYFEQVPVKRAIFTSGIDNKSYEIDIVNNKCYIPVEVLEIAYTEVTLGVYGYNVDGEKLIIRYSPAPDTFIVHDGSYKDGADHPEEITPSQYDIYSQELAKGLDEVNKTLTKTIETTEFTKEQGDYAKAQGDYAKSQAENVTNANKEATEIINTFEENVDSYTTKFNENASSEQASYNNNAESKITAFNSNASDKLNTYNTNAEAKLKAYDNNATSKLKEYNDNADEKTSAYNTNTIDKTNEFNSNSETKLEEYNSNAAQKMAEYDEHSEELDNKIIATRNELERVKNDVLDTGTAVGSYIHLEDSAMAEYQELSVDGVCKQETTLGYQMLNNTMVDQTINGVSFKVNEDKSITISGTATERTEPRIFTETSTSSLILKQNNIYYNKTEVPLYFYANGYYIIPSGGSITPTTDLVISFVYIRIEKDEKVNTTIHPMITTNEAATYEPYTGSKPSPNPDCPQDIEVIKGDFNLVICNKNLGCVYNNLGMRNVQEGVITSLTEGNKYLGAYCKVEESKIYAISRQIISNRFVVGVCNEIPTISSKVLVLKSDNSASKFENITIPKGYSYLVFYLGNDDTNTDVGLQIEENSTATPFEEHLETTTQITLPENEFAGKFNDVEKDEFIIKYNNNDGQYHSYLDKKITKRIINGTENWAFNANQTRENTVLFTALILDASDKYGMGSIPMKCDRLTMRGVYGYVDIEGCLIQSNNSILMVRINKNRLMELTVEAFKDWLSKNPLILYYASKNPYILDLGIVDMPITYNEVTNLFTDSDLMPTINAKYYRNFINTIQNLQINEKALKEDLADINNRLSTLENASTTSEAYESEMIE